MKKDVFVLTNINHYGGAEDELHVYSNVYGNIAGARNDMVADFQARFKDTFYSDKNYVFIDDVAEYMELRNGGCYCVWWIECQSVEFDQ